MWLVWLVFHKHSLQTSAADLLNQQENRWEREQRGWRRALSWPQKHKFPRTLPTRAREKPPCRSQKPGSYSCCACCALPCIKSQIFKITLFLSFCFFVCHTHSNQPTTYVNTQHNNQMIPVHSTGNARQPATSNWQRTSTSNQQLATHVNQQPATGNARQHTTQQPNDPRILNR